MNREEAIKVIVENCYFNSLVPGAEEALATAIKTLKQEPCEDCVSRQAVLKGYIEVERADGVEIYSEKAVPITYINNLPPVTPTSKKGKWILHEKSISTGFKDLRECSCCKCYFDWIMPRNSYCPNCGAEMESEE